VALTRTTPQRRRYGDDCDALIQVVNGVGEDVEGVASVVVVIADTDPIERVQTPDDIQITGRCSPQILG
jgi:hypothetical protein